jgi:hypothetical protein
VNERNIGTKVGINRLKQGSPAIPSESEHNNKNACNPMGAFYIRVRRMHVLLMSFSSDRVVVYISLLFGKNYGSLLFSTTILDTEKAASCE